MLKYLITFVVSLVSAGAVMLILNIGTSNGVRKKESLRMALGIAVGATLGEIVTDLWQPTYELVVRSCIVAASIGLTSLALTRRSGGAEG